MQTAIGIDFGTTNTRLAYCDGTRIIVLTERQASTSFIPTAVSYNNGKPSGFGRKAREAENELRVTSLKWGIANDRRFDVGDGKSGKTAEEITADFAGYLHGILVENHVNPEMHHVGMTVPVGYPLSARRRLVKAFAKGGLKIKSVYPEPVAALYAVLASNPREGYTAIFDWGGGTLDIATLQVIDGKAYVLNIEGMKEGGEDFDKWIAKDALDKFLDQNPSARKDREHIWETKAHGLLLKAEQTKWDFEWPIQWHSFLGKNHHLEYRLDVPAFEERLTGSIDKAIALLKRSIASGGGTVRLVKQIILSGGTRNLAFLRHQLETEFGDKIIDVLPQESYFQDLASARIDSATAIGVALLMANRGRPVFSKSIGVRLADARSSSSSDLFCSIFKKGDAVVHNEERSITFHVTNPSGGVANLMVCEQLNEESEPSGRLLRIFPVPIHKKETRITAKFSITEDLLLRIKVVGAIARVAPGEDECYVPVNSLGFELPPVL